MFRLPRLRLETSVIARLAAVVLLFLGAGTSPAFARPISHGCYDGVDGPRATRGKSSPGLICQIDFEDRDHIWGYTNAGQICNFDPRNEILVHCPLLREELEEDSGLYCASATFVYQQGINPHGSCPAVAASRYACRLASVDETGWAGWWFGYQTLDQNGYTPSNWLMHYGGHLWGLDWRAEVSKAFAVNDVQLEGGSYYLSCKIPPVFSQCGGQSCLASLKWFERTPK